MTAPPRDRLTAKTQTWLDGHSPGDGFGILRHLALRREPNALTELSRLAAKRGRMADSHSSPGLAYRAARLGHPPAAYNLAMTCFNRGDLQGYRRWLRRAASLGDTDAAKQLVRFETRLPHDAAMAIGRGRPYRADD